MSPGWAARLSIELQVTAVPDVTVVFVGAAAESSDVPQKLVGDSAVTDDGTP